MPLTVTLPDGIWAGMESLATLDLYQCANLTRAAQGPRGARRRRSTRSTLAASSSRSSPTSSAL